MTTNNQAVYMSGRREGKVLATTERTHCIRLIQVAKRDLGLDEDTYRQLLTETTGVDSLRAMSYTQLQAVLNRLKQGGFTVKPKHNSMPLADDAQSKLIRHLWLCLASSGVVKNSSEIALSKYVSRITKVSALRFLSTVQASKVIESLKRWCDRTDTPYKELSSCKTES